MHEKIFEGRWYTYPPLRYALIAGFITGLSFVTAHLGWLPPLWEKIFYGLSMVLGGYHWVREGLEKLVKEREIGIEILMGGASVGSILLGMWDEAAFLVFLYGSAEGLEEFTYAKTRASIRKLLDIAPKEARVIRQGKPVMIPAEEIRIGDIFVVKPGEAIPTDGIILKGRSSIHEAPVTGESMPVAKKEGMKVFAATLNQEGALEVKATATFQDNTLVKIIHLVEEAQERKGKTQLFMEKFGRIYSPLVLLSSFLLVMIPFMLGLPLTFWATRAVVLLVAAAPCALVMSTPVAIAAGIGKAGRSGVLIKGGVPLEALSRVKVVAFDKTGTLTQGKPVVTDVIPFNGKKEELLYLACQVEKYSEHPLGEAICETTGRACAKNVEVKDFHAIAGYGAKAKVKDRTIYVGKPGLFKKQGLDEPLIQEIEGLTDKGKTVVLVGSERGMEGVIAIRDAIKPEAKETVALLHDLGFRTVMLTGDNERSALAVANELGIQEIRADLKPEAKFQAIQALEKAYGAVAMVGDGINDAPALAQATVGIAMGAAGTDAAIESADIALMGDDLTKVVYVLQLGKRAKKISQQNIIFSLIVLASLIPSALLGFMTVAMAVFFHEASELLAVVNGLRVAR